MDSTKELDALVEETVERKLDKIVEERNSKIDEEQQSVTVSRRRTLGLAGLVGLGAVGASSQSVGAVEGHSLSQDLDCNEYELNGLRSLRASHTYSSYISNGDGSGNLQLYDGEAESPFLRASEDPDISGPGPIMFNAPIRGVPEDAAGGDIQPKSLQIVDDTVFNGNDVQGVGAIGGEVTDGERLESLTGQNITISDGQLNAAGAGEIDDDLETRHDEAITHLELVSGTGDTWRVGPSEPTGDYHRNGSFGILLETEQPTYLGECQIETDSAGQFTAALYEYNPDGDDLGEQVDTTTIQATGSLQTVLLDFLVDEPGQYLLTRLLPAEQGEEGDENDNLEPAPDSIYKPSDDAIELYRTTDYSADDFDADSQHGVTILGTHNPYFQNWDGPQDNNYYYYFNLEISIEDNS